MEILKNTAFKTIELYYGIFLTGRDVIILNVEAEVVKYIVILDDSILLKKDNIYNFLTSNIPNFRSCPVRICQDINTATHGFIAKDSVLTFVHHKATSNISNMHLVEMVVEDFSTTVKYKDNYFTVDPRSSVKMDEADTLTLHSTLSLNQIVELLRIYATVLGSDHRVAEILDLKKEEKKMAAKNKLPSVNYKVYGPGQRGISNTAIEISRKGDIVRAITMYDANKYMLVVGELKDKEFDGWFKEDKKTPLVDLAKLYAEYAKSFGATSEAMDIIKSIIHVSDEDVKIALEKGQTLLDSEKEELKEFDKRHPSTDNKPKKNKPSAKKSEETKVAVEKSEEVDTRTKKPKIVVKTNDVPKKQKQNKPEPKVRKAVFSGDKISQSQRFKDLIMEGKLTDRKIFETVQKEYDTADDKFGYVKWYWKDLQKKGMNPPPLKEEKK